MKNPQLSPIQLTKDQKRQLMALALVSGDDMGFIKQIIDLEKEISELKDVIFNKVEEVKVINEKAKGDAGYTPIKGKDYVDGQDYILTQKDKEVIAKIAASEVKVPIVEKVIIEKTETVREIPIVKEVIKETITEPSDMLLNLEEVVKDLQEKIKKIKRTGDSYGPKALSSLIDVNATGIQVDDVLIWNGTNFEAGPQTGTGGGSSGSFAVESLTGTQDGINTVFTAAHTPVFIDVAGQIMTNGNGYTLATLTVTFDNPPPASPQPLQSFYNSSGGAAGSLSVQDEDGTPTVTNVVTMKFPNGSVTDDGAGVVSVSTGILRSINSISVNTAAGAQLSTDYVYFVSGNTTLTLPTAVGNTNEYTVKNVSTGTVVVATTSSQTIDGSLTASIPVQYTSLTLISNGSNWQLV